MDVLYKVNSNNKFSNESDFYLDLLNDEESRYFDLEKRNN